MWLGLNNIIYYTKHFYSIIGQIKMIKKITLITVSLLLPLSVSAFPNQHGNAEKYHAKKIERLTQELELNSEQQTKMKALYKQQGEKFKAIKQETDQEARKILTVEQYDKLQTLKAERKQKRKANKKANREAAK